MEKGIPAKDLFMMCAVLNRRELGSMPDGFSVRNCRKNELDIWKAMHVDDHAQHEQYNEVLNSYFEKVYAPKGDLFFNKCKFVCDTDGLPVGTCFIWKAYDKIHTVHWLKVIKHYEGRGIGRALLSHVMKELPRDDYPVFLHTHPSSYRAIKLYSDFGFCFITDGQIGHRKNDLDESLPILKKYMPSKDYDNLKTIEAPQCFLDAANSSSCEEF